MLSEEKEGAWKDIRETGEGESSGKGTVVRSINPCREVNMGKTERNHWILDFEVILWTF